MPGAQVWLRSQGKPLPTIRQRSPPALSKRELDDCMLVKGLPGEQDREQDGFRKAVWKETIGSTTPLSRLSKSSQLALISCLVPNGFTKVADLRVSCQPQVTRQPPRLTARRRPNRSATALSRWRLAARNRPRRRPLVRAGCRPRGSRRPRRHRPSRTVHGRARGPRASDSRRDPGRSRPRPGYQSG